MRAMLASRTSRSTSRAGVSRADFGRSTSGFFTEAWRLSDVPARPAEAGGAVGVLDQAQRFQIVGRRRSRTARRCEAIDEMADRRVEARLVAGGEIEALAPSGAARAGAARRRRARRSPAADELSVVLRAPEARAPPWCRSTTTGAPAAVSRKMAASVSPRMSGSVARRAPPSTRSGPQSKRRRRAGGSAPRRSSAAPRRP